ncbi:hypothetical protein EDB86DRAFT_3079721 [Lactarius hatsudake]|nr:hypothetical protein EDB86DRAFT_3079721 [Lactarius hatsudake]
MPEVIVNVTALAHKSGDTTIIEGSKESARTAMALVRGAHGALDWNINPVIPRELQLVCAIQYSMQIPIMGHMDSLCMIYLDATATDCEKALRIMLDTKVDYPIGTLLVHKDCLGCGTHVTCGQCAAPLQQADTLQAAVLPLLPELPTSMWQWAGERQASTALHLQQQRHGGRSPSTKVRHNTHAP